MAGKSVMVGRMLCEEWSAPCVVCGNQTLMIDLDFEARMHSHCSDQLWVMFGSALGQLGGARAEGSGKLAD